MNAAVNDEYLFSAICAPDPNQSLAIDPEWKNIRLITPIGRISYATLVKPRAMQPGQTERYSLSLWLAPDYVGQLWQAIASLADMRWPAENKPNPANPAEMVTMSGSQMLQHLTYETGGLRNPLTHGDKLYLKDPKKNEGCRGLFVLNAGVPATDKDGKSSQPFTMDEEGNEISPDKIYSGCYGRAQITLYAFPKPGQTIPNRGIGAILHSVQFARHGEKLGGFDPKAAARAAFGNLPKAAPAPMPAGGATAPATGNPWTAPAPGGFAAPAGAGGFAAPGGGTGFPPR